MNKRFIFYLLGCVLCFEAAFLILPWIVSLVYGESEGWAMFTKFEGVNWDVEDAVEAGSLTNH